MKPCLAACVDQTFDLTVSSSSFPSEQTFNHRPHFCIIVRWLQSIFTAISTPRHAAGSWPPRRVPTPSPGSCSPGATPACARSSPRPLRAATAGRPGSGAAAASGATGPGSRWWRTTFSGGCSVQPVLHKYLLNTQYSNSFRYMQENIALGKFIERCRYHYLI